MKIDLDLKAGFSWAFNIVEESLTKWSEDLRHPFSLPEGRAFLDDIFHHTAQVLYRPDSIAHSTSQLDLPDHYPDISGVKISWERSIALASTLATFDRATNEIAGSRLTGNSQHAQILQNFFISAQNSIERIHDSYLKVDIKMVRHFVSLAKSAMSVVAQP